MNIDIRDILTLSTIPGIGPARLRSLVNHFKDSSAVARATARDLVAVEGVEKKTALAIVNFFRNSGAAAARKFVLDQLSRLNKTDGRVITLWDKEYPSLLKRIYDPPPFLFIRGTLEDVDNYSLAIVGTRGPSSYGIALTERFSAELARLGITVVSGLARGIDTYAHGATLKSSGRTIAVIGSGIDVIYPPENRQLVERIANQGAIISEFPMGTKPDAGNFPRRNRIISGMTLGTIVVETGTNGGAMITAATALDQNREVFAIPAPADPRRRSGTNLLIKEGKALLTEEIDDILTALGPQLKRMVKPSVTATQASLPDLSLFERTIHDTMSDEPVHIDTLASRAGMTTSDVLVHLLSMEFKGVVRQKPGKFFVRL